MREKSKTGNRRLLAKKFSGYLTGSRTSRALTDADARSFRMTKPHLRAGAGRMLYSVPDGDKAGTASARPEDSAGSDQQGETCGIETRSLLGRPSRAAAGKNFSRRRRGRPGFTFFTPSPTESTTPAPSVPGV